MSEYFKIDYNQDGWPIVTMDNKDIGRKKILQLLNSKTQEIEQLKKENETLKFKLKNSEEMLLDTYKGLTKDKE